MTIGELLRLAKTNLIEDAYYAIESLITGSNINLEREIAEITPTLKVEIEEELALYDYEWSDLVFVDNIQLESSLTKQINNIEPTEEEIQAVLDEDEDGLTKEEIRDLLRDQFAKFGRPKLNESSNTDFKPMSKAYHKKYGVGVILRDSGKDCREGEVIFKPNNNSSLPLIPHPSKALSGPEHYTSDIVSISDLSKEPFNENKIDLKPILESVVKKLKQEGRYFQEKDNIKKMVLKEAMDLAKVKNNKQVIANKMRGGKVQLKEGISYLSLEKGETYTWTRGAEYANIKYIGKTSENPEAKIGSSMGKGLLFQWSDGKYFELSPNAVRKYVNKKDLEESKKSNKRSLKEGSYDDFRDNYGRELNACLRILRAFGKKIDKEEITDEQWSRLERTLKVYDRMVQEFVLNPRDFITSHDIANLAIENQNRNGTEMKMVINAIDDLGGVLGLGSAWYEEEEDEELDEAVTVNIKTLEKDTDKISKVAEKTDITITENKQYKMKTKEEKIKSLTEAIQKMTGKKVVLAEKKKDIIKTLKEEITKRAKLVYYIKTGKKVTLKEAAGEVEEGTTLEDQVNLENNIDTPTLGNIMPTSIIKTIEQYVSTTLAEIDKSTTELRTIKKNIVLNSGPSDGSFETLINRIGFLLKQLERVQRYTSNTIKAGVFNKSILDKIFEQKELLNEIK